MKTISRQFIQAFLCITALVLISDAPTLAADVPGGIPATNIRVQNVLKAFVGSSGHEVIGLGSWITGKKYSDVLANGASDHDIRLISKATSPAAVQREWLRARATITDMVKKEFGKDADKVLKSINLYPPSQIMKGVEDASDALSRFKKLGNVPNLGYTGPVAQATEQFAEGLYGPGSTVWTQAYEKQAGRIFYTRDGKVFTGFTDLLHMSEGIPKYDAPGMCNTASQWADHLVEEMHGGRGDKVAKYLERLDRDLAKAKDLSRINIDPRWRARTKEIVKALGKNPGRLSEFEGEVAQIIKRSRDEAAIVSRMAKATSIEKAMLAEVMKDMGSSGPFSKILKQAGEVVTLDRVMTAITVILHVRQTAKFAGEEEYNQAVASALAGVVGIASFPVGFVAEMTNWVIESAKTNGYAFAASTQEAWDLMAGIHTAVGRTDVEDRGYTLEELVAKIDDEKKLEAVVWTKSWNASSRGFGGAETGKTDQRVGEAIFARCWPIIRDAWRERREELALEYTTIMDELEHTPVLLKYTPVPAEFKPEQKAIVTVSSEIADAKFSEKMARAKQILTILYRDGVFADVEWKWTGGKEASDKTKRVYEFDTADVFPVTLTVKVNAGAANARIGQVLARKFDLQSGIDVRVEEAAPAFEYPFMSMLFSCRGTAIVTFRSNRYCDEDKVCENQTKELKIASDIGLQDGGEALAIIPVIWKGHTFSGTYEFKQMKGSVTVTGTLSSDSRSIADLRVSEDYLDMRVYMDGWEGPRTSSCEIVCKVEKRIGEEDSARARKGCFWRFSPETATVSYSYKADLKKDQISPWGDGVIMHMYMQRSESDFKLQGGFVYILFSPVRDPTTSGFDVIADP